MTAKPMNLSNDYFNDTPLVSPFPCRLFSPSPHFPALYQVGFKTVNSLPEKRSVFCEEKFKFLV